MMAQGACTVRYSTSTIHGGSGSISMRFIRITCCSCSFPAIFSRQNHIWPLVAWFPFLNRWRHRGATHSKECGDSIV